jgi:hypothetical protein
MKTKYTTWTLIITSLLILLLVIVFNTPIPISITMEGLKVKMDDKSFYESVTLTFEGNYHINLFKKDEFSGMLVVAGYKYSEETHTMLNLEITNAVNGYTITYKVKNADKYTPYPLDKFGNISSKKLLNDVVIIVFNKESEYSTGGGYSATNAVCIVANETSYERAIEKAECALGITRK